MTSRHIKILSRALLAGFCLLAFFGLDSKNPWSIPLLAGATVCVIAGFVLEVWTVRRNRPRGKDGEV